MATSSQGCGNCIRAGSRAASCHDTGAFELELDDVLRRPLASFKAVAKHQPVQRDITVIVGVNRISHGDL